MLSVLIPAKNEIYLERTIRNVLENARGDIEVLVMLDGYIPDPQIVIDDNRVIFHHNEKGMGQRPAINFLAKHAKGDFLMKLDAHCAVDEGFDVKLAEDYEEGWVVIPRMYNLDIETWLPKRHKVTDYMYIGWKDGELRSLYYGGELYKEMHKRPELIDDTMGCMGPCRFMSTKTFWDLGGCDEGHGGWGSEGIEWACKAWLSGGRLVVNKKTWFAHWFRGGSGPGFPYKISQSDIEKARLHAENLWLDNKWPKQKRKFQWLLDKFAPPGWDSYMQIPEYDETFEKLYKHYHRRMHYPKYKGVLIQKFPSDLQMYHQVIWEKQPDVIVEIGSRFGGSALYFQDQLDMLGKGGKVITIDIKDQVEKKDPRITYLLGDSKSEEVVEEVRKLTEGKTTMVVVDGNHSRVQVKWELHHYVPLTTPGQYIVVEDCYVDRGPYHPRDARDWYLAHHKKVKKINLHYETLCGVTNGGWLLRV